MKMIDRNAFLEICVWIHRNARPLELALWNYRYENGKVEAVTDALAYYQNQDGGFGNGIEPDCWNPDSSPYATLKTVELLRKTGIIEETGSSHPLVQGIFRFLDSGVHCDENGWFFSIPSNDDVPRAPWWTYSEETNRVQGMGITAGLCAFILRYGKAWTELYEKSLIYVHKIIDRIVDMDDYGEMGVDGVLILLKDIAYSGLSGDFHCDGVLEKLSKTVNQMIVRDPEKWQYYTPRPSAFISSPDSPFYKGNEEIVETQLDYLIDMRIPRSVFNITWSWFDLGEQYAKEFAISENWWKCWVAMDNLEFLNKFGRVESPESKSFKE